MIYGDKPVLRAILEALGAELDEFNETIRDLQTKRWIQTAEGIQLDKIGEIVDRNREVENAVALRLFGFRGQPNVAGFGQARFRGTQESGMLSYVLGDAEYRLVLAQKVMKNVTRCTAEDTIRSLRFIFSAQTVVIEETGNASIAVAIGRQLTDNEKILANAVDLIIRAGGVKLKYKACFPSAYFGFLGQPRARGFGRGSFAQMF